MASADDFMKGLEALRPHFKSGYPFCAEHDVFYVHTTFESEEETPQEIRDALGVKKDEDGEDCGGPWHWDDDADCWAVFT